MILFAKSQLLVICLIGMTKYLAKIVLRKKGRIYCELKVQEDSLLLAAGAGGIWSQYFYEEAEYDECFHSACFCLFIQSMEWY